MLFYVLYCPWLPTVSHVNPVLPVLFLCYCSIHLCSLSRPLATVMCFMCTFCDPHKTVHILLSFTWMQLHWGQLACVDITERRIWSKQCNVKLFLYFSACDLHGRQNVLISTVGEKYPCCFDILIKGQILLSQHALKSIRDVYLYLKAEFGSKTVPGSYSFIFQNWKSVPGLISGLIA